MGIRQFKLRQAIYHLHQGDVIAYPTEAVFGLGCDPDDEQAIVRLLQLKQRPAEKGLILIAANFNQLQDYMLPLNANQLAELNLGWPGPNTWLVPVSNNVSPLVTGGSEKIAVRVTAHPIARELCRQFGGPIISTSANLTGLRPVNAAYQVRWQLPAIDFVMPGSCGGSAKPSRIRDITTGATIR